MLISHRKRWASGHWDGALVLGTSWTLRALVRTPGSSEREVSGPERRRNPISPDDFLTFGQGSNHAQSIFQLQRLRIAAKSVEPRKDQTWPT